MADDMIRRGDAVEACAQEHMRLSCMEGGEHEAISSISDRISDLPAATPTVQDAAKVLMDKLNTSDGFRVAANAAMPILQADINETAWNTADEVVLAISAAIRAIAGDSHE